MLGEVLVIILLINSLSLGVKLILTLSVSKCLGWQSDIVMKMEMKMKMKIVLKLICQCQYDYFCSISKRFKHTSKNSYKLRIAMVCTKLSFLLPLFKYCCTTTQLNTKSRIITCSLSWVIWFKYINGVPSIGILLHIITTKGITYTHKIE